MELNYIETSEQAKSLSEESNFWVDTGNDVLFFVVDANFFVLLPILCFKVNLYTLGLILFSFMFLAILKKKDITLFEFLSILRLRMIRTKYRRRK